MAERNRSIRDLNQNELDHVINKLVDAIGASTSLEKAGRTGSIMESEVVQAKLSLPQWPPPQSTPIELAWFSEPLGTSPHGTLNGHSVFWALTDDGFQVWIGRTPYKPESTEAMGLGVDTRDDGQGKANGASPIPIDGDEGGVR